MFFFFVALSTLFQFSCLHPVKPFFPFKPFIAPKDAFFFCISESQSEQAAIFFPCDFMCVCVCALPFEQSTSTD